LKFKRPFETRVGRKQEIFVTFQCLRQATLCRKMAVPGGPRALRCVPASSRPGRPRNRGGRGPPRRSRSWSSR